MALEQKLRALLSDPRAAAEEKIDKQTDRQRQRELKGKGLVVQGL